MIGTPRPLISALEKIAARYGNIRNLPCWHHGSIADRILAVERLSLNPDESVRFHARLRAMRKPADNQRGEFKRRQFHPI